LALDLVVDAFRNIAEKQVLQWFTALFERTGVTFEQKILGAKGIDTTDPANIESVLSTKFSSKMLEIRIPLRRKILGDDQLILD